MKKIKQKPQKRKAEWKESNFQALSTSTHQLFGSILCIILGSRKLTDVWPLSLDRLHVAPRDPPPKPPQPIRKTPYLQRSNALLLFLLPPDAAKYWQRGSFEKNSLWNKKKLLLYLFKVWVSGIDIKKNLWNLSGCYFQFFSSFCLSNFLPPRPRRWRAVTPRQGCDTLAPSVPGDPQGPGSMKLYIYIYIIYGCFQK